MDQAWWILAEGLAVALKCALEDWSREDLGSLPEVRKARRLDVRKDRQMTDREKLAMREALHAMGYHEASPEKWIKPVGFHLFTYEEEVTLWSNWFVSTSGTILPYAGSRWCDQVAPLYWLKECEGYARVNVATSHGSHFELSAQVPP
jgi:hypothetical protein